MSCSECERRRRYMSADPEMYRGDDMRCTAHQELDNQLRCFSCAGTSPESIEGRCRDCGVFAPYRRDYK